MRTFGLDVDSYWTPTSLAEIVNIIQDAEISGRHVHAVGAGYSFEDLASTGDWMVDLTRVNRLLPTPEGPALTTEWNRRQLDRDSDLKLVHVEAGIRLFDLNTILEGRGLALPTMGGAQGQQLAGAISTSTHGSDYQVKPFPDLVEAVHLVSAGGQEYWIEGHSNPLTNDDDALRDLVSACGDMQIIRDDDLLNAVVVSCGRFGIIYSLVIGVTQSFRLAEFTEEHAWSDVKAALLSGVGQGPTPRLAALGGLPALLGAPPSDLRVSGGANDFRYIDIVFNPRKADNCWVRRRWATRFATDLNMSTPASPLCEDVGVAVRPSILLLTAVFLRGYSNLIRHISPIHAIKAGMVVDVLAADLEIKATHAHMSGGEALSHVLSALWDAHIYPFDVSVFVDKMVQFAISSGMADSTEDGRRGASWHMAAGQLDPNDDINTDCYRGSSIEVVFGLDTRAYINFIDALLAQSNEYLHAGYMAVRFSRKSDALLSMHNVNHHIAVSIEVTTLRGLSGNAEWMRWLEQTAIAMGGRPHWGQHNNLNIANLHTLYGANKIYRWRDQLIRIAGFNTTFSNDYSIQRGLEPSTIVREITHVRRTDGAISHLCNPGQYWSPVAVELAMWDFAQYYVIGPGDLRTALEVRHVLTTTPDDTRENNLGSLPDAPSDFIPSREPESLPPELNVTSVIRSTGRFPSVRFLCNTDAGWKVPRGLAIHQIRQETHAYFITIRGVRTPLVARTYFTTHPDGLPENNLGELPEC